MKGTDEVVTAQAPGKLFIAGEYAVVETGYPAIIVALDQFVTVTVTETTDVGSIVSEQYQENALMWQRNGDEMVFDNRDNPFHYILSAIRYTEQYAHELGRQLTVYDLRVDSELDSEGGRKYGLGSSAAITVATVRALDALYHLQMTNDEVYKLSAIAHLAVQGNGSLGDIAASVYGGWIAYRSFDKTWLAEMQRTHSLKALLAMTWPQLSVELLKAPKDLALLIGWTGSPASTSRLVDKIAVFKANQQPAYREFLAASRAVLEDLIEGFHQGAIDRIQAGIRKNRLLLEDLSRRSGVAIETPALRKLCDIAESFGAAAKSSGAGGGDCGIALIDRRTDFTPLLAQWQAAQIEPLRFKVHEIKLTTAFASA